MNRLNPLRSIVALALAVGLAACGDPEVGESESPPDAAEGPLESTAPMTLELVETVDGGETPFGEVAAVVADEDGRMYVADRQALQIVVLDSAGNRAGTIGGPGEGPGEFRNLDDLAWAGDRLAAFDWRQGIVLLDRDGEYLTRARFGGRAGSRLFSSADGVYGMGVVYGMIRVGEPRPPPELQYVHASPTGSVSELSTPSDSLRWPQGVDCQTRTGIIQPFLTPFADWGPRRAFLPSGLFARVRQDPLRIDLVHLESGELVGSIPQGSPVRLTDERWERQPSIELLREYEAEYGSLSLATDPERPCPLDRDRPEFLPPVASIVADLDGRLWVETPTAEGFQLSVHDSAGALLGEAPMPERDPSVPFHVRGDRLYLVTTDDLDVQSIEVYRVRFEPVDPGGVSD